MLQLEEWTNRKVFNILFDSDIDNWSKDTSVFYQRIKNKEHIIIIIEDEEGNKFGGYVDSKIDKVGADDWINDSKSFVFSLDQTDNCLFAFGYYGDICVHKANYKTKSFCYQDSFEYEGIPNALCGKQHPYRFTPKRIIVIEMK
ncbi:trichohyalin, putative [Entamoeba histolytica]